MDELSEPIVSPDWLRRQMRECAETSPVCIVDASWRLPGSTEKPARVAHAQRRLPGAVFFDLDGVSDRSSPLPHMAPSRDTFDAEMARIGVGKHEHIIVYDDSGLFSAARVWWMFRMMGYRRVSVLDGGLPAWIAQGGETETGAIIEPVLDTETAERTQNAASTENSCKVDGFAAATATEVRAALLNPAARVLDARPADRFTGKAPEPRPGLHRGAMPGAVNLPFSTVLGDDGRLLPDDQLRQIFADAGVRPDTAVIATCGSGVSAAILILAMAKLGYSRHALYDGSWAEWGAKTNDPSLFPVVVRSTRVDGRQD